MWDLIVSVPDHCSSFYFLFVGWKQEKKVIGAKVHQQYKKTYK